MSVYFAPKAYFLRKSNFYSTMAELWDHKTDSSNWPAGRANTSTIGLAKIRNSLLKRSSSKSIASGAKKPQCTKKLRSNQEIIKKKFRESGIFSYAYRPIYFPIIVF